MILLLFWVEFLDLHKMFSHFFFYFEGHSQGGMAIAHLYNYYWTGLNIPRNGKVLQAVGTPWQGVCVREREKEKERESQRVSGSVGR
jgi:hypothetical protein